MLTNKIYSFMVMTRKGFLEGNKTQRVGGEREHSCKGVKRMKWAPEAGQST